MVVLIRLVRVLLILALAVFAVSFVIGVATPDSGMVEKLALVAMFGSCIFLAAQAMFILGATTVESYKEEKDLSLRPGQSTEVAGFTFAMNSLRDVAGPNYQATESEVVISRNGRELTKLYPQKRVYRVQKNGMTEAGIDGGWNRDLFVAMGEPLGDGAWSLRLQYKPMVRFIWLGALVIAIGGLIAVCDRRYRQRVTSEATSPAQAGTSTA